MLFGNTFLLFKIEKCVSPYHQVFTYTVTFAVSLNTVKIMHTLKKSLWDMSQLQACVICRATRPITSSVSVDVYSPADYTNIGCYLTTQVPHHSANTQCTVNVWSHLYATFDLSILLGSSSLYHLDLFSLLLSNLSLFFLLTLPPTKESCLRISYLRPLDCHPPFQFLTNPTYSTHVLSTHSSLLSFVR